MRISIKMYVLFLVVFLAFLFILVNQSKIFQQEINKSANIKITYGKTNPRPADPIPPTLPPTEPKVIASEKNIQIHIQDLLGNAIKNATLTVNDSTRRYDGSGYEVKRQKGMHLRIQAEADGYRAQEIEFNEPIDDRIVIQLDYVLSFLIRTYKKNPSDPDFRTITISGVEMTLPSYSDTKSIPFAGAKILLSKIADAPRPVVRTLVRNMHDENYKPLPYSFIVTENNEITFQSIHREDRFQSIVNDDSIHAKRFSTPQSGDVLIAFINNFTSGRFFLHHKENFGSTDSNYIHLDDDQSYLIKMWDALSLQNAKPIGADRQQLNHIECSRNGMRYHTAVPLYYNATQMENPQEYFADGNGNCWINDLPPGVYAAQAVSNQARSVIRILHPIYKGIDLVLHENSKTTIKVSKKHLDPHLISSLVPGAKVTLRSRDTIQLYSGVTDKIGVCIFTRIPFGLYDVRIEPPEGYKEIITDTLLIDKTRMSKKYEVETDDVFSISGRVLIHSTSEPVKGFPLRLTERLFSDQLVREGESDGDGSFHFENLPPGSYCLSSIPSERSELLPYNEEAPLTYFLEGDLSRKNYNSIELTLSKDIENIIFYVESMIETQFTGVVMFADGTPAVGAKITILPHPQSHRPIVGHGDNFTKPDGTFHISASGVLQDQYNFNGVIIASAGKFVYSEISKNKETVIAKQFVPLASNSQDIQFKTGDVVRNIKIVLDNQNPHKISGVLHIPEGVNRNNISIKIRQNDNYYLVDLQNDDSFYFDHLMPGIAYVIIAPINMYREYDTLGSIESPEFKQEYIMIDLSTEKEAYLEIDLLKTDIIAGKVIPASELNLENKIITKTSTGRIMSSSIDKYNAFILKELPINDTYDLYVSSDGKTEEKLLFPNLTPPIENLLIEIKE